MMMARTVVLFASLLSAVPTAMAQDRGADGERLFKARCGSCHTVEPGRNGIGPHLADIAGRSAGTVDGAAYSQAMRGSGLVWDQQTLDTYLASPTKTVPGTSMPIGVPNAGQRAAIIAYLLSRKAGPD